MKRTKRLLSLLLCVFLIVGTLCACRNNTDDSGGTTGGTQTSSTTAAGTLTKHRTTKSVSGASIA